MPIVTGLSFSQLLRSSGVNFQNGPFTINLKSSEDTVIEAFQTLYSAAPIVQQHQFIDFNINIRCPSFLRRFYRPQIEFQLDGIAPFKPLPRNEAFPLFEWGLNWCVATHAHQYFMLHAAVLEKNGLGIIFPAPPGSGKSTLCAELAFSGWRLLSDEFALLSHDAQTLTPFVRPISLKNESIEILTGRHSNVQIGSLVHNTSKGSVAHLKPLDEWISRRSEAAKPRWIIFPQYKRHSNLVISPVSKAQGMMSIISNSFNYAELGSKGFDSATKLTTQCEFFNLVYSDLNEAVAFFDNLFHQESLT